MALPLVELVFSSTPRDDRDAPRRSTARPERPRHIDVHRENADLVDRIRAGDASVFTDVVHDLATVLHAYAYQYVHSADIARDVVQDVFIRLWERRESLHVGGTLRQYLFVATRLRALELLRRQRIEGRHADALGLPEQETPIDEELEALDRFAKVVRALEDLPPRQREIVRLRWLRGLTNMMVAQQLGISVKGVEIQLTRALHTLRERLRNV